MESYEITKAKVDSFWGKWELNRGGVRIEWACTGVGFGTLDFYQDTDGTLRCDDEYMGRDFAKAVMNKFIDQSKFSSDG